MMFVYAPQVGRPWEAKESFVEELEDIIRKMSLIPINDIMTETKY